MPAIRPVTVDLATGVVTIGGTRVSLERADGYFTAPGGFRARALTFAERSSIVAGALIDPEPHRALLTKLRALAAPSHDTATKCQTRSFSRSPEAVNRPEHFQIVRVKPVASREADWQSVQQTPALLVDQISVGGGGRSPRGRLDSF